MKKFAVLVILTSILLGLGYVGFNFYPYIFAKSVSGVVESIEKVDFSGSILSTNRAGDVPSQFFSFAVAVRDAKTGEILTGSTEDRAWATIEKGYCVDARFFPHPPWNLEKSGTYQKVRLDRRFDCQ